MQKTKSRNTRQRLTPKKHSTIVSHERPLTPQQLEHVVGGVPEKIISIINS